MTRTIVRGDRLRLLALLAVPTCLTGAAYAATASGAEPAAGGDVTIANAGDRQLRLGESLTLSGRAGSGRVRLEYAPRGEAWRPQAQASVARGGSYRFTVRPRHSGAYRAVSSSGSVSPTERVTVQARVAARSRRHLRVGSRVRVRGKLAPAVSGRRVLLQQRTRRGWKTVDRARTRPSGRFRAAWRPRRPGSYRLRVRFAGDRLNTRVGRWLKRVNVYRPGHASWYGPGFMGGRTACGGTLTASVKGVAHKSLPCGTRVTFRYRGRTVTAKVIDRGPFVGGREWDLTPATKRALRFPSTGTVWSTR